MNEFVTQQGTPLVSVVMPAYNAAEYIEAAVTSVQRQSFTNWELIVVDDCSSDETCPFVERLARQDPRIRLYHNAQNQGTAYSRNHGLEQCRGDYVALLDSDDIWHPEKLEKQLALIQKEGADLVYTSYAIVDEHGQKRCNDFLVPSQTDFSALLKENVIGCSTVLMTHKVTEQFLFDNTYYHEDYVLWLQMLRSGKRAVGVTDVLVDYRYHSGSRASNKLSSAKRRWTIYRSYLGLSRMKSIRYLMHYGISGLRKYKNIQ